MQGRLAPAALVALTVVVTVARPAVVTAQAPISREQAETFIQEIRQLRQLLEQLRAA